MVTNNIRDRPASQTEKVSMINGKGTAERVKVCDEEIVIRQKTDKAIPSRQRNKERRCV